jgi:uncharacterized membrane protein
MENLKFKRCKGCCNLVKVTFVYHMELEKNVNMKTAIKLLNVKLISALHMEQNVQKKVVIVLQKALLVSGGKRCNFEGCLQKEKLIFVYHMEVEKDASMVKAQLKLC